MSPIRVQVLLLLMNLSTYTEANRRHVMELRVPLSDGCGDSVLMMQALVEYFYRHEEMAQ